MKFKSFNDLSENIFKDELPSSYRHPRVIQGTSICGCIHIKPYTFFLVDVYPCIVTTTTTTKFLQYNEVKELKGSSSFKHDKHPLSLNHIKVALND